MGLALMTVNCATILICTYNRAPLLRESLRAMAALKLPANCDVEILVVDNNSTDTTRQVIADAAKEFPFPIIGLHERAQGKSFALNLGLQAAKGDIVALTDDDVWPDPWWLHRIVERFRERDVTFVFGKVLPRWGAVPPADLLTGAAQDIWGPLALVDYGDNPAEYTADRTGQRLPIGANLAFRRDAVVKVGGWRTDLGKVNNTLTSGEDHEIFCRLRRFNLYSGFYDPAVVVRHYVPGRRLTRQYFRRWFFWSGKTHALMLNELYAHIDVAHVMRIAGTPRFLWRQALQQLTRYLRTRDPRTPALLALKEELRLLQYCGLIAGCWRRRRTADSF
jgi:cellulose synthase/poly-beta-1,6-N-acetylglucosamine synthase-like glycosyltransferase